MMNPGEIQEIQIVLVAMPFIIAAWCFLGKFAKFLLLDIDNDLGGIPDCLANIVDDETGLMYVMGGFLFIWTLLIGIMVFIFRPISAIVKFIEAIAKKIAKKRVENNTNIKKLNGWDE